MADKSKTAAPIWLTILGLTLSASILYFALPCCILLTLQFFIYGLLPAAITMLVAVPVVWLLIACLFIGTTNQFYKEGKSLHAYQWRIGCICMVVYLVAVIAVDQSMLCMMNHESFHFSGLILIYLSPFFLIFGALGFASSASTGKWYAKLLAGHPSVQGHSALLEGVTKTADNSKTTEPIWIAILGLTLRSSILFFALPCWLLGLHDYYTYGHSHSEIVVLILVSVVWVLIACMLIGMTAQFYKAGKSMRAYQWWIGCVCTVVYMVAVITVEQFTYTVNSQTASPFPITEVSWWAARLLIFGALGFASSSSAAKWYGERLAAYPPVQKYT